MSRFWKRFFDIFASALLLVVLSPLFLVIMLAISADSAGGVIFKQKRAGLYSRPFTLYKFRTMYRSAPRDVATAELMEADRYITPVGRFLRQTSLDELPQLWNVLKGDMSFVGPRPVVLTEQTLLDLRAQWEADRVRRASPARPDKRTRRTAHLPQSALRPVLCPAPVLPAGLEDPAVHRPVRPQTGRDPGRKQPGSAGSPPPSCPA